MATSHDRSRHVTPKGQIRDSNTLRANISKTAGDAISQQSLLLYSLLWGSTVGYPNDSLFLLF